MKIIFTLCSLLTLLCAARAQTYFKETVQTISPQFVYSLTPTANRTVMMAANALTTQQAVPEDYIGEFAADGSLLWNKSFLFKDDGGATGAIKTTDGGSAMTTSAGYFVKLNTDHSVRFIKKLVISGNIFITIRGGVLQTADKGYVFAGAYGQHASDPYNNVFLCKVDSLGNFVWCRKVLDHSTVYKLKPTKTGGFLIAGYSTLNDQDGDMAVAKADSLGNVVFSATAGGTFYDEANDVAETSDGGCLLVGQTETPAYVSSSYIAKYSATGVLQWTKSIKLSGGYVVGIGVLSDRQNTTTVISVVTNDSAISYESFLNVSNNGKINKSVVSRLGDNTDAFFSASCRSADNSIWLATPEQYQGSGVFTVYKSDETGKNCVMATIPLTAADNEGGGTPVNRVAVDLAGGVRDAQYQSTGDGGTTVRLLCSSQNAADALTAAAIQPAFSPATLSLSPNPASSFIHISGLQAGTNSRLWITDVTGKTIAAITVNSSFYNWNIAKLVSGLYYMRVQTNKSISTLKFIKQ